jgi:hypothetical protein
MSHAIRFRCPSCGAKIKAPTEMLGSLRLCPGCCGTVVVRPSIPEEQGPILVNDFTPYQHPSREPARR